MDGLSKSSNKRKRETVVAACERCRNRKVKCDARRPICSKCEAIGHRCVYTVLDGQTRYDAHRAKYEKLEEDFSSMRNMLELLKRASPAEAEELLQGMRTSKDTVSFANSFQEEISLVHPQQLLARDSSRDSLSIGTPETLPALSHGGTPESSRSSVSLLARSSDSVCKPSGATETSTSDEASALAKRFPDLARHLEIPSERSYRAAIHSFHDCSGKLFHVCDHSEIESAFDRVFRDRGQESKEFALCRLNCLACVGCLYMKGTKGNDLKDTFYQIAKSLLDTCIEQSSLASTALCTLIAMFNLMSRSTVSFAYIELGVSLCRRHQLHTAYRPTGVSREDWTIGKRSWRTLIFFGAWLSATLGYLSGNEWELASGTNLLTDEHEQPAYEDMVQIEMVKIAILKRNIMRIDVSFPQLAMFTVDTVNRDLRQWYADLPPSMQLCNLLSNGVSTELRRTVYFVHLLYLGSLMLLHRRIAIQSTRSEPNVLLGGSPELSIIRLAGEAEVAAEQTARILGLLIDEDGVFERCWICCFQAYTAGILLLHRLAHSLMQTTAPSDLWVMEHLERADKCLRILIICGSIDPVATKFRDTVQYYYDKLREVSNDAKGAMPDLQLETELYHLVLLPFDRVDEHEFADNQADDLGLALNSRIDMANSMQMRSHLQQSNYAEKADTPPVQSMLEKQQPTSLQRTGEPSVQLVPAKQQESVCMQSTCAPMIHAMLEGLKPAQTFQGFTSCGWL